MSDESYLKGRAALSGKLKLTHNPVNLATGFQLGVGANDQDGDFGLNGESFYNGTLTYKKVKQQVAGIASLNADAQLCATDCELKTEDEVARFDFSGSEFIQKADARQLNYLVYPNPVQDKLTIEPAKVQDGQYHFTLYNMQGQLVHQSSQQMKKEVYTISTKYLASGIYRLEMISPDGSREYVKIIHY